MRVVAELDPHRLEAALLDTVARMADAAPARRVVVLVPTARLVRHVERRLAGRRDAWVGVTVMHLRAVAHDIVEREAPPQPTLSPRLLDRVLGAVLRRRDSGRWPDIVRRRPGAQARLRASLTDLREAGIGPAAFEAVAADHDEHELAAIYAGDVAELDRLAETGLPDDAALTRRAVAGAGDWLGPDAAAVIYGAYELNGIQLDLVQAIDAAAETVMLVPCSHGASASRFAERWATTHLSTALDEPLADGPGCGLPLVAMFDETARPSPAAPERIGFRHAQGEAAEFRAAMRDAIAAVGEGCPPEEIAIVARSLAPYAAAIDAVAEETGVPIATSVGGPLRREPLVRDALTLLRAVAGGMPRRETAELLGSPRMRWRSFAGVEHPPRGDDAELWSRGARIVGGRDAWTRQLPSWLAARRTKRDRRRSGLPDGAGDDPDGDDDASEAVRVAAIVRCVETLDAARPRAGASWVVHAGTINQLLDAALRVPDDDEPERALGALRGLLDEMARLDELPGAGDAVGFETACSWLESAVDGTTLPRLAGERGIRVLDAMQARGMTFRRVALLGLNAGRFPQQGTEDPILSDDLRRRLIAATGRPVPLAGARVDEERLLLALSVGASDERLDVSWQRADESGRSRTPSLALRELARLAFGRPDVEPLDDERTHHPSHPEHALERFLARPGLLLREEAVLLAALRLRDVDSIDRLAELNPELADGLRVLQATQSWAPSTTTAAYDGRVGHGSGRTMSVSALERLGNCPLRYFFSEVLRIDDVDDEPDALEILPRELGSAIHDVLEAVYREVADAGGFQGELDDGIRLALRALDARRDDLLGQAGEAIRASAPRLWTHLARRWHAALTSVIREDLGRLHRGGFVPVGFEHPVAATLDLGQGIELVVRGRLDRRMRSADGELVSDYKTSSSVHKRLDVTQCLKGRQLQVGLYAAIVEGEPDVELIAIHPDLRDDESIQRFAGLDPQQRASFEHTLRVLVELDRDGVFPLRKDRHCSYCAYAGACRRNHPPTAHREAVATDALPFHGLSKKAKTKPFPTDTTS